MCEEAGAGFFRLRQTEFRRRYGLYAKGAEKFPDLADLAGIVTGDHQLAGLELSDRLFLALRFVHRPTAPVTRSEEHTSELQSLMRIPYAVFCLKKKT